VDELTAIEKACLEGRAEEAAEILAKIKGDATGTADYHYQAGLVQEAQGQHEQAIEAYERALQLDARHRKTLFRLAYVYDLRGEENLSIDYYKQCIQQPPVHVGALMNLAVLYEELGDAAQLTGQTERATELYDEASEYLRRILAANPNHARARLFLRDVEKSRQMYYDEEKERRADKRKQKLDIPVTDFELSVRSRNCLQKMNVNTLGDLIKHTEVDLLGYKNFGETSLSEIKEMLASQGLYLGMASEQSTQKKAATQAAAGHSGEHAEASTTSDADLNTSVTILELNVRSRKCLETLNVKTFGDLVKYSEKELLACENFGRISLNKIKETLASYKLALKPAD